MLACGELIYWSHKLTIDDLIGSRLHLFATSGNPVQYQIEAVNCSVREHCHKTPYYRWSYKVSDKPVEVSLYGLKDTILELLSLSDKLDSAVELTISGPIRPMTFVISRYSTTIDYDRQTTQSYRVPVRYFHLKRLSLF